MTGWRRHGQTMSTAHPFPVLKETSSGDGSQKVDQRDDRGPEEEHYLAANLNFHGTNKNCSRVLLAPNRDRMRFFNIMLSYER